MPAHRGTIFDKILVNGQTTYSDYISTVTYENTLMVAINDTASDIEITYQGAIEDPTVEANWVDIPTVVEGLLVTSINITAALDSIATTDTPWPFLRAKIVVDATAPGPNHLRIQWSGRPARVKMVQ